MKLQDGSGNAGRNGAKESLAQDVPFIGACNQHQHAAGGHHRSHAHGIGCGRHRVHAAEKAGVKEGGEVVGYKFSESETYTETGDDKRSALNDFIEKAIEIGLEVL